MAFSPDGRRLCIATRGGWLHAWDLEPPEPRPVSWRAHPKTISGVAYIPDGKTLLSWEDATLALWDAAACGKEKERATLLRLTGWVAWRPDGKVLACTGESHIDLLSADTLKPAGNAPSSHASEIAFSPDGQTLAVTTEHRIVLLDAATGNAFRTLREPDSDVAFEGKIHNLEFDCTGSLLLAVSSMKSDRKARLREVATGRLLATLGLPGQGPLRAVLHPEGGALAAANDGQVQLYELAGLSEQTLVAHHPRPLRAIALARSGVLAV